MTQSTVSSTIVEPYAEALMSVAQSNSLTNQIGEDVNFVLGLLKTSSDLTDFLVNPLTPADAQKAVLRQLAESRVQKQFFNFLLLLIDRRRIIFLEGICKQYQALLRKLNNTVLAEVTSTIDLSDEQKQAIIDKVKQMTQAAQVEIETSIDPDLIGGVIIKVGSQVLDASIRGQLRRMNSSIANIS
ncbi:ATP synthase F1 subunit delta [Acaryochloris sp. IP29b_bin.137]|uniref:ATP synthase F1 subunit delta n=1 Tax=Acaryochloris sp. IP29b_bin.137 TaxID=2969217 RepID=UPI0026161387|nr:ATP synthase F1 subunit delta [Acaryochloris sp. IP29b_bin.137]